jgi:sugar lactone lactonase YvrE
MLTTSYNGNVFMPLSPSTGVFASWTYGLNAIAISPDGEYLYYGPLSSRRWYRIQTKALRVPTIGQGLVSTAGIDAKCETAAMGWLPSHLDGIESDASGNIYLSAPETNSIYVYNPARGLVEQFLKHGMIQWPDTLSVADDGKLYFTVNQLWL